MGKGGGGGIPGLTPEETQNQALSNQLLQMQIEDALTQRKDAAYKASPAYLNQQAQAASNAGQAAYTTSKANAQVTGQNNIKNAFADLGQPDLAAPYLAALNADAAGMSYHHGAAAANTSTPYDESTWNEQAYLDANPDVAAAVRANKAAGGQAGVGYGSGLEHYQQMGRTEGRQLLSSGVSSVGADTWDDPSSLATKDYIGSTIDDIRRGRKDTALGSARGTLSTRLNGLGLDADTTNDLSAQAGAKFDTLYNTAGLSANDYTGVFDPDAVLNSVMDTSRSAKRGGYTTATRAAFNGIDPSADFSDTADDSYINDIVGRDYTTASDALTRARARGSLTDTGYSAGMGYLGDQRSSALSTAQTLGGAVLTRDRGELSGIKDKALTTAGGWDFGQTFDPNTFLNQYSSKKGALSDSLGGDVSNALAGQNWFNVGDVLTKAGYAQGAQNVKPLQSGYDTPALAALGDERRKNSGAPRGLGGTGVF